MRPIAVFLLLMLSCPRLHAQVVEDSLLLSDRSRGREIPVWIYRPKSPHGKLRPVILSHGYAENRPGANRSYSFIGNYLALHGCFVASIQHELPSDSLLPSAGIPQIVRRPAWERGAANILFALHALKRRYPQLDYRRAVIIGHSNGGDMSALFAQQHPELTDKLITLDNRRMALPRTKRPRVYSLRSADQPADEGVLPSPEEQRKYRITIIRLPGTPHNDMGDRASEAQRKEINDYLLKFLEED